MTNEPSPSEAAKLQPARRYTRQKLAFAIVGLFLLFALFGIFIINSFSKNDLQNDQKRHSDFAVLYDYISAYYLDQKKLPVNLQTINELHQENFNKLPLPIKQNAINEISKGNHKIDPVPLNDPATNKPYEYKPVSNYEYELCTNFSTEVNKDENKEALFRNSFVFPTPTDYFDVAKVQKYTDYFNNVNIYHKKGYNCIKHQIQDYILELAEEDYDANNTTDEEKRSGENNSKRRNDTMAILNAITLYYVSNKATPVPGIIENTQYISTSGANICSYLVPEYISSLPIDPSISSSNEKSIINCSEEYNTGYTVSRNSNNNFTVTAPYSELSEKISVTR